MTILSKIEEAMKLLKDKETNPEFLNLRMSEESACLVAKELGCDGVARSVLGIPIHNQGVCPCGEFLNGCKLVYRVGIGKNKMENMHFGYPEYYTVLYKEDHLYFSLSDKE